MAVALRGSVTTANASAATSVSVTAPTGLSSGDVIVIWLLTDNALTPSCTGFTAVSTHDATFGYVDTILWRVADGTEGASFSVNGSPSGVMGAICAAFSGGAGGTTPFDPSNPTQGASNMGFSTTASVTGPTTTVDGDMILWLLISQNLPSVPPVGFTRTQLTSIGGSSVNNAILGYEAQATAGAVGTITATFSATTGWDVNCIVVKAVGPAPYALPVFRGSFVPHIRASRW